jgi:glycosyltransferase involved in cell wall biosynthesis
MGGTDAEPVLGIGLPVRNGARYLAETLQCLSDQKFADIEVLIADNCSTDETEEIARAAAADDPRIRYVRHERNLGADGNFNYVFQHTRGELFAWLASDDRFDPRFYLRCVQQLRDRPDAVASFAGVELIDSRSRPMRLEPEPIRADDPDVAVRFADLASYRHYCQMSFAVVRRAAAARTRLLMPFWGSDRLYLVELGLQGTLVRDPDVLFFIRQHEDRVTRQVTPRNRTAYQGDSVQPRAVTLHYARRLSEAVDRADHLSLDERRRVRRALGGWAVRNLGKLGRSTGRGLVEVGRSLVSRRG